jgi:hypothetical protein
VNVASLSDTMSSGIPWYFHTPLMYARATSVAVHFAIGIK